MDAVRRLCRVLLELLIRRPVIACVLALFYVVGGLTTGAMGQNSGLFIAIMSAIPAAGLCAIATERLVRYAAAAGALGIPRHAGALRSGQFVLFLLLVAL